MGLLRRFMVSFDYAGEKIWLVRGSAFAATDRYDRSGTWLALHDAHRFEIEDVAADGPAARSGLRSGDLVTSIDRIGAGSRTLATTRERLSRPDVSDVVFHIVRNGMPLTRMVVVRDLIASN